MAIYEYKTVVAPRRARKVRGVKGKEAQFAATIADILNREAVDGWEYFRTDQLLAEERKGLFSRRVERAHSVLVFRRGRGGREPAAPLTDPAMRPPRPEDISGEYGAPLAPAR